MEEGFRVEGGIWLGSCVNRMESKKGFVTLGSCHVRRRAPLDRGRKGKKEERKGVYDWMKGMWDSRNGVPALHVFESDEKQATADWPSVCFPTSV